MEKELLKFLDHLCIQVGINMSNMTSQIGGSSNMTSLISGGIYLLCNNWDILGNWELPVYRGEVSISEELMNRMTWERVEEEISITESNIRHWSDFPNNGHAVMSRDVNRTLPMDILDTRESRMISRVISTAEDIISGILYRSDYIVEQREWVRILVDTDEIATFNELDMAEEVRNSVNIVINARMDILGWPNYRDLYDYLLDSINDNHMLEIASGIHEAIGNTGSINYNRRSNYRIIVDLRLEENRGLDPIRDWAERESGLIIIKVNIGEMGWIVILLNRRWGGVEGIDY